MMGGAVAADFELDQWTFFKPTPGRPVPALRHRPARGAALPRLPDADRDPARGRPDGDARGRLVLPARRRRDVVPHRPREVDDHRGVDRRGRQGAALLPQHRLPRALRRGLRQAVRDLLRRRPPADLRRAAPSRRRPGPDRRRAAGGGARAARGLPGPPPGRQPVRPLLRPARGRPAGADRGLDRRTTTPTPSTTRGWSAPRWSCWPATCAGCSPSDGREGRGPARRRGRRLQDAALPAGPAARLRRGRRGRPDGRGLRRRGHRARRLWLAEPRAHRPGVRAADAGARAGRRRGHATSTSRDAPPPRPACSRSAASPPSGTCWSTAPWSRSGRSMFERHVGATIDAGDHEVRIVVHPLTELLDTLPEQAAAALAHDAGRGRPAALGAHPAARPGARLLAGSARGRARTARSPWSPARGGARLQRLARGHHRAWSRSTAESGSSSPTSSSGGRTPTARRGSTT